MKYTPTESMVIVQSDNREVMRITREGIWVDPEMPTNDAAKKVMEALGPNIKYLCDSAWKDALKEAAAELDKRGYADVAKLLVFWAKGGMK